LQPRWHNQDFVFAPLPLLSQKPGAKAYAMVENICRCRCEETPEAGFADVEFGELKDV
jgi:hypothetical protein